MASKEGVAKVKPRTNSGRSRNPRAGTGPRECKLSSPPSPGAEPRRPGHRPHVNLFLLGQLLEHTEIFITSSPASCEITSLQRGSLSKLTNLIACSIPFRGTTRVGLKDKEIIFGKTELLAGVRRHIRPPGPERCRNQTRLESPTRKFPSARQTAPEPLG